MPAKSLKTLDVRTRKLWRRWLQKNHAAEAEVWLVFYKQHTGEKSIDLGDAIDEALCFGWIDSLVRRLDEDRYARKFTPRKPDSRWSTINRQRYAELKAQGLLAPAGLQRAPTDRDGDAPRPSVTVLPAYLEEELRAHPRAWDFFQKLALSCKRNYIAWVDSAKREETKRKRLNEMVGLLKKGQKLGLK
ncbi:MAG TPA: YdeI/OmpD-associated family protein [Planctomycetaceae bacterium]|nr:YdeI/OmpD-associated family protein [Planctomycetaceae bacterium]